MSEEKTISDIQIPIPEIIDINLLREDKKNPNVMSDEEKLRLMKFIKKHGFIVPIVTNQDLLIADGSQRLDAAKKLGMKQVSVIRLPLKEVDRLLARQVLNKLKGKHDPTLDTDEIELIKKLNGQDDLKNLLAIDPKTLEYYRPEPEPEKDSSRNQEPEPKETEKPYKSVKRKERVVQFGIYAAFIDEDLVNRVIEHLKTEETTRSKTPAYLLTEICKNILGES